MTLHVRGWEVHICFFLLIAKQVLEVKMRKIVYINTIMYFVVVL